MRTTTSCLLLCCGLALRAQVSVDTPVALTGPPSERAIDGIAAPVSGDAVITVEGSVRSEWSWGTATVQGNAIALTTQPAFTAYRNGSLVRFVTPSTMNGAITLAVDGLPAADLVRPDGLPITVGQMVQGRVCEVMYAEGRFVLLNAREVGCPQGFLFVNANYCIEATSSPAVDWTVATDNCNNKGGQLCTWGEHHAACTLLQGQFTNMFVDYEWVDDTSNHSHTANQVARVNCLQQRSGTLDVPARVRCCYHPR